MTLITLGSERVKVMITLVAKKEFPIACDFLVSTSDPVK